MIARMALAVNDAWNRITAWLADHAPAAASCVNPPASPAEVAAVERELGHELPADLVSWWHRANGTRSRQHHQMVLPPLYAPLKHGGRDFPVDAVPPGLGGDP
jgi:cell wall assembly regulator SMI1